MTGPPLSYYHSCVPRALSALTGLSIDMVTRALWQGGASRPMGVGSNVQNGTDTLVALDLMAFRFGVRAELAIPSGVCSVEQTADYLASQAHAGVVNVRRHRADPETEGASEDDAPASSVTVATWPHAGPWMLEVAVDGTGHALALIDKQIITGGEQYRDHRVSCGWHIITNNEEEEAC